MSSRILVALLVMTVAMPLAAEEDELEEGWSGSATLGYLATSGNTENSNLNSALEVNYVTASWVHTFDARAINATESGTTTAEAYQAGWKSEWQLSDRDFLFGRLRWNKDRFSAYERQFSQTVGYGRRVIDTDAHRLNVEVGAGARQSDRADGATEDEIILRGALDYTWVLSETAEFRQDLGVEAGDTNTYIESVTALTAQLIGRLALVASYTIRHNTDVVPATEKTDTFSALSLEYRF